MDGGKSLPGIGDLGKINVYMEKVGPPERRPGLTESYRPRPGRRLKPREAREDHMADGISVRVMRYEDLEDMIEIDTRVLGRTRPEYWQMKVELVEKRSMASLVAEVDGRVVGFVLGDASGWEYGVPESIGIIDTIGVLPEYQKKGVARALMNEMTANLKKVGVEKIYTMVDWRSWDLLKFFNSLGFRKGEMINLELDI